MQKEKKYTESARYTLFGTLFGLCFPVGSIVFLRLTGQIPGARGFIGMLAAAHASCPLLYVIDSAPIFLGLFARLAGVRQDRIQRFSRGLEQQVSEKTESLRRALEDAHRANEMVIHMAEHDALTGLFNRRRFQKDLEHWVRHAERYHRSITVMFVDIDRLKTINDSYGHAAGDRYLMAAAEVLRGSLRATDYLARWGGDEFALLLPETGGDAAIEVANKLLRLFGAARPMIDGEHKSGISASIGIALMPGHTTSANELLMFADAAMYEAKNCGRSCWRMYSASSSEVRRVNEHASWEKRIRRALDTDQFTLLYQPLLDLRTGATHSYEALLRMEDRDGLLITPGMFLESAEQFDLSVPIDRMVIRKVVHKLLTVGSQEPGVTVSVNLSRKTIRDDGFMGHVAAMVSQAGIDPHRFAFEIPEHILLEDFAHARRIAGEIRDAGHVLIMDDFGAGTAPFRSLQQLMPHMLKLGAGLLEQLADDSEARQLVKSVVSMAHDLGITVTAKFIEDPAVLDVVARLGIDFAQGFAVGKPIEAIEQLAFQNQQSA